MEGDLITIILIGNPEKEKPAFPWTDTKRKAASYPSVLSWKENLDIICLIIFFILFLIWFSPHPFLYFYQNIS